MLTIYDHALALVLVLLFPLRGWFVMKARLGRASDATLSAARRTSYRESMAIQWTLAAAAVLLWYGLHRSWSELGVVLVMNGGLVGIVVGLALVAMIMLRTNRGGPDEAAAEKLRRRTAHLQRMLPRTPAELREFSALAITAGICEELLYRGYLIAYLQRLGLPLLPAAGVSALVFGFGHLYQGPRGMISTGLVGGFLAAVYLLTGSLFAGVLIHAMMDLYSGFLLYRVWTRTAPPDPAKEGAA